MGLNFFGKSRQEKFVRDLTPSKIKHTIDKVKPLKSDVVENNEVEASEDMSTERLEKIEDIMGTKAPKPKVKVEKKEKGLIERAETVVLNEDNKMLLND